MFLPKPEESRGYGLKKGARQSFPVTWTLRSWKTAYVQCTGGCQFDGRGRGPGKRRDSFLPQVDLSQYFPSSSFILVPNPFSHPGDHRLAKFSSNFFPRLCPPPKTDTNSPFLTSSSPQVHHMVLQVTPSGLKIRAHSMMSRASVRDQDFLHGNFSLRIEPASSHDVGRYTARVRYGSRVHRCELKLDVVSGKGIRYLQGICSVGSRPSGELPGGLWSKVW